MKSGVAVFRWYFRNDFASLAIELTMYRSRVLLMLMLMLVFQMVPDLEGIL